MFSGESHWTESSGLASELAGGATLPLVTILEAIPQPHAHFRITRPWALPGKLLRKLREFLDFPLLDLLRLA
jgi:hypothetical protein